MDEILTDIESFGNKTFIECGMGKVVLNEKKRRTVVLREILYDDIKSIEYIKPYDTQSNLEKIKSWLTNFSSKGGAYLTDYLKITYSVGDELAVGGYDMDLTDTEVERIRYLVGCKPILQTD